ncbi:MAG: hypothetical protein QXT58_05060 [Archaeoglobaceae archaeon]
MLIVELLELYEKNLKEGRPIPTVVPEYLRKPVAVGQIRELWTVPVERFVILDKTSEGLYLTVPMTSYLQLLPHNSPVYEIKSRGLRLGVVPVWDYLRQELIENYSQVIGKASPQEIERIRECLKQEKQLSWHTRRFIRLNSKLWANLTLFSMLSYAEEQEEDT